MFTIIRVNLAGIWQNTQQNIATVQQAIMMVWAMSLD